MYQRNGERKRKKEDNTKAERRDVEERMVRREESYPTAGSDIRDPEVDDELHFSELR